MPDDVIGSIAAYPDEWRFAAAGDGPFDWSAVLGRRRLELLVRYWANVDLLTDELVDRLGLGWAPPSTRPFFDALVAGVDAVLRRDDGSRDPFARALAR